MGRLSRVVGFERPAEGSNRATVGVEMEAERQSALPGVAYDVE